MRKLVAPAAAAVIGFAVLLNLGFWQMNRLAWKEDLIAKVTRATSDAPVPSPTPEEWRQLSPEDDYRRVFVQGTFLPGEAFYYIALPDPKGPFGGPGVMVYSPFRSQDGWVLMVNRGFLPQDLPADLRQKVLRPSAGPVRLTGLLRLDERPVWTTPAPDRDESLWFARDTASMAAFLGADIGRLAPFSIDLEQNFTPADGLPQAGETIVTFKNDHLGYALTWFGLAATLLGVFLAYAAGIIWPRGRETDRKAR